MKILRLLIWKIFFKISKDTIIRYLKKGMELGLCTYDFERKKNSKRIEVFKNNVS